MVNIIDTHTHLNDEYFINSKEDIINNLKDNELQSVFVVGYDNSSSIEAVSLATSHKNVYAIIGMHPNDANKFDDDFIEFIKNNAENPKVIGIGEIGLDYYWNKDNKELQKMVFVEQIKLAYNLQLPIVIHCRDAVGDLIEILKQNKQYLVFGGVVHCFNESIETYQILKNLGFKFSFGGAITFKNSVNAKSLIKNVDLSDIMLETDCPYLTPEPFRGKERNQPKYVKLVLEKIAEYKNIDVSELAKITNKNVYSVFKKVKCD